MKYLYDEKQENIKYIKRPGAYAIIERKEDNKIGIVTTGKNFFFLGGGIENSETKLEALKREVLEESGFILKKIKEFDEIGSFIYSEEKGYLEVLAYVYTAEFDEWKKERIEKDHTIVWVTPGEYIGKMYRPWQEYILGKYIEKSNKF